MAMRSYSGIGYRVIATAILLLLQACTRSPHPPPAQPNIVLITIDTLRADRVGAYGHVAARTPFLDNLAAEGLRFDEAVTHSPLTFPAHVSIMTGHYPSKHGARDNGTFVLGSDVLTMASALRTGGYDTGAFVASFVLDSGFGLDRGFDVYDDTFGTHGPLLDYDARRPAADVAARSVQWIREAAPGPFFAWIHMFDPHRPYEPPPPFSLLPDPYDGEVAAADAGVGQILSAISDLGLDHRTAVIVTSDHGEGLGEHGEREHGLLLYDSVIRVPLIMRVPGVAPGAVSAVARHVDLMPTVLKLAGLPLPPDLAGDDLLGLVKGSDPTGESKPLRVAYAETWYGRLHFGWSELRSLRADGWKYIDGPEPELYDLRRDPREQRNRLEERPELAARLRERLQRLAVADESITGRRERPDAETLSKLRALGYISGGAPRARDLADSTRANPKDMVAVFERYVEALNSGLALLQNHRAADAVERFRQLVREHPTSFEAIHYLGYALAAAGRHRDAVIEYDRAVNLHPAYALAHFNAARSLAADGRHASARQRLERGFTLEPRSFYGFMVAGVVAWGAGDDADAVRAFEQAASLNPADSRAQANLAEAYMRTGDYARARESYRRIITMNYKPAAAHFNLGVIGELTGDIREAEHHYRQALDIDPGLQPARDALAKIK